MAGSNSIRDLRLTAGLTPMQAAAKADRSLAWWMSVEESGPKRCELFDLRQVAHTIGCDVLQLLVDRY